MSPTSSILYQNTQQTAFLVDLPASIELAQIPSSNAQYDDHDHDIDKSIQTYHRHRQLLSSKPLEKPYPSPPEPKSQAARARLLGRIPESEILFHESVAPFVAGCLDQIKREFQGAKYCRPRRVHAVGADESGDGKKFHAPETPEPPRKKVKTATDHQYERSLMDLVQHAMQPPMILSPSSPNNECFSDISDLRGVQVKNPSYLEPAIVHIKKPDTDDTTDYTIPPRSSFILDTISATNQQYPHLEISPIPGLPPTDKFNAILFDPPWPNRSVRRSSQYMTHGYLELDSLIAIMQRTILTHLAFSDETTKQAIVGIWTTNNAKSRQAAYTAFKDTGLEVFEIWIWMKITENGELVSPLDGLWRKSYEVLFLGRPRRKNNEANTPQEQEQEPVKRVVAAVPDEHSRKPNLRGLLEKLFFRPNDEEEDEDKAQGRQRYTALEVFARNLTAGWCACGNDVLKFNAGQWWSEP